MAEQSNRSKSSGQSKARKKKTSSQKTTASPRKSPKPPPPPRPVEPSLTQRFTSFTGGLTVGAFKLAAKTGGVSLRMARALLLSAEQLQLLSPEQAKMMRETGAYLKDLREVAGLTRDELSQAIDLSDKTVLPGLIDAHAHPMLSGGDYQIDTLMKDSARKTLRAAKRVRDMLYAGYTSVRVAGDGDKHYG